jgi:hypothetical protein
MSGLESIPIICPSCGYRRQADDAAPDWQCPACGIAYAKAQVAADAPDPGEPRERLRMRRAPDKPFLVAVQKVLSLMLFGAVVLFGLSWWHKGELVDYAEIDPALLQQPRQTPTLRQPLSFAYRERTYEVDPVADYEIWGLVVSHNDIYSIGDIYHDESSVDTKNLCMIWGGNLESNAFHQVKYESGSFTCYFSHPFGVEFLGDQLSNNHLISDQERVRRIIGEVRIGDQVHIRGMLVNYGEAGIDRRFWRKTSTTRSDSGNKACEIVFVEDIDVLAQGTPGWYKTFALTLPAIPVLVLLKLIVFFFETPRSRPRD